jgi:hypothetical protein
MNTIKTSGGCVAIIPHTNHNNEMSKAGNSHPPMPREKYSSAVNSLPKILLRER